MGAPPLERVSVLCVVKPFPGGLAFDRKGSGLVHTAFLGPGEFEVLLCTQEAREETK